MLATGGDPILPMSKHKISSQYRGFYPKSSGRNKKDENYCQSYNPGRNTQIHQEHGSTIWAPPRMAQAEKTDGDEEKEEELSCTIDKGSSWHQENLQLANKSPSRGRHGGSDYGSTWICPKHQIHRDRSFTANMTSYSQWKVLNWRQLSTL